ncbi:MAG: riboflavin biosynthesis protein RibF [Bacteroidota bacterium]
MKVYRSFDEIERKAESVITTGTFDGVHKGHKIILDRLKYISRHSGLRHVLVTMHPHPRIVLQRTGLQPLELLTNINERLHLFEHYGIGHVLVIPFTYEFSCTPPDVFIRDYLHGMIGMEKILVGYDHMFGKNREGNMQLLNELSEELNFSIEKIEAFSENDTVISSTKIRQAIKTSELARAREMLGYDYFLTGQVVHGDARGAQIGFPTANIRPTDEYKLMPGKGVYFVSAVIDGKINYGMANIGTRPTFTDDIYPRLEIHFFDFDRDIYGMTITVKFLEFIRPERKFSGPDEFRAQLEKDRSKCFALMKKRALK